MLTDVSTTKEDEMTITTSKSEPVAVDTVSLHLCDKISVQPSNENSASEPPVQKKKKKQKPGGSFCGAGQCSNSSSRHKNSKLPGRKFLRFYKFPNDPTRRKAWAARVKREQGWEPTKYTRVCSDHFSLGDFNEEDLRAWDLSTPRKRIRLKSDAIPNTDRSTGFYVKHDQQWFRDRPPKRRPLADQNDCKRSPDEVKTDSFDGLRGKNKKFSVQYEKVKLPENSRTLGCQAGHAYIHESQDSYFRSEIDNFMALEMLLGPEEETDYVSESDRKSCDIDPDWDLNDNNEDHSDSDTDSSSIIDIDDENKSEAHNGGNWNCDFIRGKDYMSHAFLCFSY